MAVKKKMTFEGYETLDKTVKKTGNSAHVMVKKTWIGKSVTVVLTDPPTEK
jgi:putative transposon-encoded protein